MKNYDLMRPKNTYDNVLMQREKDGKSFSAQFAEKFVEVACPACGSTSFEKAFEKFGFGHRVCGRCRTLYCSPRPVDELLSKYYNEFEAPKLWTKLLLEADTQRKMLQYKPRVDKVINDIRNDGRKKLGLALDIGAGSGAYSLALKSAKMFKEVIAFDISEDCVEVCRKKGLKTETGQLIDLDKDRFEFLCMNDLVEHLFDPLEFLGQCLRILKPGGYLSIATPNGEGFDFKILREKTKNITPPEHLNYFNPHSIEQLLKRAGFEVVKTDTPGMLDVEIVLKEKQAGFPLKERNDYLDYLLDQDEEVMVNLQRFISENGLSSHMLVLAKKRKL
jgi:2-polyprenyl-3-methyl-5-hydroxy-6-metoxy-1,4-benzoquinol methylase